MLHPYKKHLEIIDITQVIRKHREVLKPLLINFHADIWLLRLLISLSTEYLLCSEMRVAVHFVMVPFIQIVLCWTGQFKQVDGLCSVVNNHNIWPPPLTLFLTSVCTWLLNFCCRCLALAL